MIGLLPTAGNVSAEQATANVHTLIDVVDPLKWPKLAAALPARYDADGLAQFADICVAAYTDSLLSAVETVCWRTHSPMMAGDYDAYRACMTQLGWHRERVAAR